MLALVAAGVAAPVLAYKVGYHAGRSAAAAEMAENWERLTRKEIARAERRMRGNEI